MNKKVHIEYIVLVICLIIFIIVNILGLLYVAPKEIHHKYYGIEFQSGNPNISKKVFIEIKGHFKRELWGFNDQDTFWGTITIDGESYKSAFNNPKEYVFINSQGNYYGNNYGDTIQSQNRSGELYKRGMLEEIAIIFFESNKSKKLNNVWVIAGPCENREEAVRLTNSFINKSYTTLVE